MATTVFNKPLSDQVAKLSSVETLSLPAASISYDSTTNLITFHLVKRGNICTVTTVAGRTKAISANTDLVTLPEGWRPKYQIQVSDTAYDARIIINPTGAITTTGAYESNKLMRISSTYVIDA